MLWWNDVCANVSLGARSIIARSECCRNGRQLNVPTMSRLPKKSTAVSNVGARAERLRHWILNFLPPSSRIDGKELLRMVVGVALALLATGLIARWWGQSHHTQWLFASMGASAMLLICTPSSPMAQPWPVVVGSLASGVSGWVCALAFDDPVVGPAMAVTLSIAAMIVLRSLHPPGAALAMWWALEGFQEPQLLVFPIFFNLIVLVLLATLYSRMTGKRYPAPQHTQSPVSKPVGSAQIIGDDLDQALKRYNGVLDVSRADLEGLLQVASHAAFKRTLGNLRCADIMTQPVHAVPMDAPIQEAWTLMQERGVKALPVLSSDKHVLGIVTSTDILKQTLSAEPQGLAKRLTSMVLRRAAPVHVVGDLMSTHVDKVNSYTRVVELIEVFSQGRHRYVPVVNDQSKLVGMITQSDLIKVLAQAVAPAAQDDQNEKEA